MNARFILKRAAQGVALVVVFPLGLACGFGRVGPVFTLCAHSLAQAPGILGNLLRGAFYKLTLRRCSIDTNIAFGTFFVYPDAEVASHVSIGSYCVIGRASIGYGTQIASHVGIPGGRHHHERDAAGRLGATAAGRTEIGEHCWIGESAVVMGDVGPGTTIGAGAVVVKDIPGGVVAVGNPAKIVVRAAEA
ncbi:MAG: acyltransferase [Acidobacteriia bacterium]|nr:acyltransferase [Terriglobia bacterium]